MKNEMQTIIIKTGFRKSFFNYLFRTCLFVLGISVGISGGISGCTKETPFEEAPKFDVENKSLINEDEYIFTASTGQMSRTSPESRPYAFAESKRVRLQMTEDHLQVLETEKDARFKDNSTNDKLVIAIPIKHVDFACAKDSFGECSNKEIEDTKKSWKEKRNFYPLAKETRSAQEDLLPINFQFLESPENLADSSGDSSSRQMQKCFTEFSSQLKSFSLETDALNVTVTRHYKVDIRCLRGIDSLSDTTVSADFHYSMVKVKSITTPHYSIVSYPSEDQNTFGFFQTERSLLDAGNEATESGKISMMNRWNPQRKEIVFHLTDNFYEKRNQLVLGLTVETVKSLNQGLKEAGVGFEIKISDEKGKSPNDIRNSMIVLVEDPVAAGLLGYGPQTEDPLTGEIVSARTVMFLGTAIQSIRRTYEELMNHRRNAQALEQNISSAGSAPQAETNVEKAEKTSLFLTKAARQSFLPELDLNQKKLDLAPNKILNLNADFIRTSLKDYTKNSTRRDSFETALEKYRYLKESKHCEFTLPHDSVLSEISPQVLASLEEFGQPWETLTQDQKNKVISLILPSIWIPTLIHELGHNLGLRHNFTGSEDKDNFFTDEELASKGLNRKIPSSSVMEYIEDVRALPVLGKYDLAALRFGYLRKVESKDGSYIQVPNTLSQIPEIEKKKMKKFEFCTDEHTGINAGCRRFDLGTSNVEIVQNLIDQYEKFYSIRNLRRGRAHFSLVDDIAYASRIRSQFRDLRLMFEVNERIAKNFRIPYEAEVWTKNESLRDLRSAAVLAGEFLIRVASTPDLTCVFAKADKPETPAVIERLAVIAPKKDSCFELKGEISPEFVPMAQFGKPHLSRKSEKSTNAFADQIDLRGLWIDKLMAINTLFERKLNNFSLDTQGADNFADLPELRQKLLNLTVGMALNKTQVQVPVLMANGSIELNTVPVEVRESFVLPQMISPSFSRILGIPEMETRFVDWMVKRIPHLTLSHPSKELAEKDFANIFTVERRRLTDLNSKDLPPNVLTTQLGLSEVYLAYPENLLARALFTEREETLKQATGDNQQQVREAIDSIDRLIRSLKTN
jgi:hypothetical protein